MEQKPNAAFQKYIDFAITVAHGALGAVLICAYLFLMSIMIAGSHLIFALLGEVTFHFKIPNNDMASFLLFPGTTLLMVDAAYIVSIFMSIFGLFSCMCLAADKLTTMAPRWLKKKWKNNRVSLLLFPLLISVGLHACGNIHYQLYCALSVINDTDACQFMYNGYTFLSGLAGLAEFLIAMSVLIALCYPGYYLSRRRLEKQKMNAESQSNV